MNPYHFHRLRENGNEIPIRRFQSVCLALALFFCIPTQIVEAQYEIPWYTIDGGGSNAETGGAFALSGTFGQPDAGKQSLAGGFSVVGGFWGPLSISSTATPTPVPTWTPTIAPIHTPTWTPTRTPFVVHLNLPDARFKSSDSGLMYNARIDVNGQFEGMQVSVSDCVFEIPASAGPGESITLGPLSPENQNNFFSVEGNVEVLLEIGTLTDTVRVKNFSFLMKPYTQWPPIALGPGEQISYELALDEETRELAEKGLLRYRVGNPLPPGIHSVTVSNPGMVIIESDGNILEGPVRIPVLAERLEPTSTPTATNSPVWTPTSRATPTATPTSRNTPTPTYTPVIRYRCTNDFSLRYAGAIPIGTKTVGMLSADFNEDGHVDLAIADSGGRSLHLLYGTSGASFFDVSEMALDMEVEFIATGDLNRDGHTDLVALSYVDECLRVFLGDGSGDLVLCKTIHVDYFDMGRINPIGQMQPLAVGDINGDGTDDILAAIPCEDYLTGLVVWHGGTLPDAVPETIPLNLLSDQEIQFVQIADIVQDVENRKNEIIVGTVRPPNDVIIIGDESKTFTELARIPTDDTMSGNTIIGFGIDDVNLDGYSDMLVAPFDGTIRLVLGGETIQIRRIGDLVQRVLVDDVLIGDLDRDGVPDLLYANRGIGAGGVQSISVVCGESLDEFAEAVKFETNRPSDPFTRLSALLEDVNGDSRQDVLILDPLADEVVVFINESASATAPQGCGCAETLSTESAAQEDPQSIPLTSPSSAETSSDRFAGVPYPTPETADWDSTVLWVVPEYADLSEWPFEVIPIEGLPPGEASRDAQGGWNIQLDAGEAIRLIVFDVDVPSGRIQFRSNVDVEGEIPAQIAAGILDQDETVQWYDLAVCLLERTGVHLGRNGVCLDREPTAGSVAIILQFVGPPAGHSILHVSDMVVVGSLNEAETACGWTRLWRPGDSGDLEPLLIPDSEISTSGARYRAEGNSLILQTDSANDIAQIYLPVPEESLDSVSMPRNLTMRGAASLLAGDGILTMAFLDGQTTATETVNLSGQNHTAGVMITGVFTVDGLIPPSMVMQLKGGPATIQIGEIAVHTQMDAEMYWSWDAPKRWPTPGIVLPTSTPKPTDTPTEAPTPTPQCPGHTITIRIPGLPDEVTPLEMVCIPSGTFIMGASEGQYGFYISDELPSHQVTITRCFYLGKYEVTQAQWEAVMENNPSHFNGQPNHPVESVSWEECQEFLRRLNGLGEGVFRLPTEAEWEYACRVGSNTRYFWGEDPDDIEIDQYTWYKDNSSGTTHDVGLKSPNPWQLHDMVGNVFEWCEDWYEPYVADPQVDPIGQSPEYGRNMRGGSWAHTSRFCQPTDRSYRIPTEAYDYVGFRVLREYP
ncbi:MAG TPA: SUMF1/EgtB/PvdO family nonheme iron enzyme [bacterium]|nr:SUMF1/EgtB/PvdO family nonheme iron enzyme [bacterium]HQL63636.1 SUMF1/EgtB/PvdO family nonheme iron enzyme [bacterium]